MSSGLHTESAHGVSQRLRSLLIRLGFRDVRIRAGAVLWLVGEDGWWTLNWISVFDFCPGVVRFTNRFTVRPPARQWLFELPNVRHFELSAALAEVEAARGEARAVG